jgi:hypothetical protein
MFTSIYVKKIELYIRSWLSFFCIRVDILLEVGEEAKGFAFEQIFLRRKKTVNTILFLKAVILSSVAQVR